METATRGGICLDLSPRRATFDHHELPIKIAVGGGHKNLAFDQRSWSLPRNSTGHVTTYLFSVPYDFCATLLDMTMTVRSPKARRFGARMYWSIYGLVGGNGVIKPYNTPRIDLHLPDECVKIGGSTHLTHLGVLDTRNAQSQVVLGTRNEVIGNFIIRGATIEAVMCRLRRDAAERLRRVAPRLRLTEETIQGEAGHAI